MKKKTAIEISVLLCLMLMIGGWLAVSRLYTGRDLASRTVLAAFACCQKVTLYSEIILNPDDDGGSPFPSGNTILVDELHAEDGRFGYAVYFSNGKDGYQLQSTELHEEGILHGFFLYKDKRYYIFQCNEPNLERLVVNVTDDATGEHITKEFEMGGGHIYVTELPEYPSCTITSTFYDIQGNVFE